MDDFEKEEAAQEADNVVGLLHRIIDGAGRLRNKSWRGKIVGGRLNGVGRR